MTVRIDKGWVGLERAHVTGQAKDNGEMNIDTNKPAAFEK